MFIATDFLKYCSQYLGNNIGGISEFDRLIDQIKGYRAKNDIIKILEEKEISYLIKDETGVSDKFLIELVELITLFEKDQVGGAYLNHLVREN